MDARVRDWHELRVKFADEPCHLLFKWSAFIFYFLGADIATWS